MKAVTAGENVLYLKSEIFVRRPDERRGTAG